MASMTELMRRPKASRPEKTRSRTKRATNGQRSVDVSGKTSHEMATRFGGNKGKGKGDRW